MNITVEEGNVMGKELTVGMLRGLLKGLEDGDRVGGVIEKEDGSECIYGYELCNEKWNQPYIQSKEDTGLGHSCLMLIVRPED